jgi:3D-(3,5/4)-trihydroxycyclohexane-1,2-dione acylhydrolase (decyclizing)
MEPFAVDFVSHAKSMGANAEKVESMADFNAAFARAKAADRTYVIQIDVDPYEGWTTEGHAWWEVGTPEVSDSAKIRDAHSSIENERKNQRKGV